MIKLCNIPTKYNTENVFIQQTAQQSVILL